MKYFDENVADGAELITLHELLVKAFGPVASNLYYHEVRDDADTTEHRETLARSAYNLIGVCEAIVSRVPEDEAARALAECRRRFDPSGAAADEARAVSEAARAFIQTFFGRY